MMPLSSSSDDESSDAASETDPEQRLPARVAPVDLRKPSPTHLPKKVEYLARQLATQFCLNNPSKLSTMASEPRRQLPALPAVTISPLSRRSCRSPAFLDPQHHEQISAMTSEPRKQLPALPNDTVSPPSRRSCRSPAFLDPQHHEQSSAMTSEPRKQLPALPAVRISPPSRRSCRSPVFLDPPHHEQSSAMTSEPERQSLALPAVTVSPPSRRSCQLPAFLDPQYQDQISEHSFNSRSTPTSRSSSTHALNSLTSSTPALQNRSTSTQTTPSPELLNAHSLSVQNIYTNSIETLHGPFKTKADSRSAQDLVDSGRLMQRNQRSRGRSFSGSSYRTTTSSSSDDESSKEPAVIDQNRRSPACVARGHERCVRAVLTPEKGKYIAYQLATRCTWNDPSPSAVTSRPRRQSSVLPAIGISLSPRRSRKVPTFFALQHQDHSPENPKHMRSTSSPLSRSLLTLNGRLAPKNIQKNSSMSVIHSHSAHNLYSCSTLNIYGPN